MFPIFFVYQSKGNSRIFFSAWVYLHHQAAFTPKPPEKVQEIFLSQQGVVNTPSVIFFKKYNDTYGHPAGDDVLSSIGKVLKENMQRNNDACFRLGGEEFAVLSLLSNYGEASILAEKILLFISNLNIPHEKNSPGVVTVSIGVAFSSKNNDQDMDAISQADKNLYTAKKSGRNKYILS